MVVSELVYMGGPVASHYADTEEYKRDSGGDIDNRSDNASRYRIRPTIYAVSVLRLFQGRLELCVYMAS